MTTACRQLAKRARGLLISIKHFLLKMKRRIISSRLKKNRMAVARVYRQSSAYAIPPLPKPVASTMQARLRRFNSVRPHYKGPFDPPFKKPGRRSEGSSSGLAACLLSANCVRARRGALDGRARRSAGRAVDRWLASGERMGGGGAWFRDGGSGGRLMEYRGRLKRREKALAQVCERKAECFHRPGVNEGGRAGALAEDGRRAFHQRLRLIRRCIERHAPSLPPLSVGAG